MVFGLQLVLSNTWGYKLSYRAFRIAWKTWFSHHLVLLWCHFTCLTSFEILWAIGRDENIAFKAFWIHLPLILLPLFYFSKSLSDLWVSHMESTHLIVILKSGRIRERLERKRIISLFYHANSIRLIPHLS